MAGSSAYHFGRAMYKAGHMSRRQIARDAIDQIRFRLRGATDAAVNVLLERVLAGIKGHRVVDLRRMTPDVLAGILPRIYPQMLAVVREHQDSGRPLLHRHRGVSAGGGDPGRGARHGRRDGNAAGRSRTASTPAASTGPFAYGEGKAERLREFARRAGIDLEQSWAYSDAASDLPMLEAVGHPVAVNPDAALAEVARREGWEVLRFEKLGERLRVAAAVAVAAAVGGSGSWLGRAAPAAR